MNKQQSNMIINNNKIIINKIKIARMVVTESSLLPSARDNEEALKDVRSENTDFEFKFKSLMKVFADKQNKRVDEQEAEDCKQNMRIYVESLRNMSELTALEFQTYNESIKDYSQEEERLDQQTLQLQEENVCIVCVYYIVAILCTYVCI